MSNEHKVDPFLTFEFLGQTVKVEYTMASARIFALLAKKTLIGPYGLNWRNPNEFIAFIVSGLWKHQRELVGEVDANGVTDEKMKELIARIEDMPAAAGAVEEAIKPFINALSLGQPVPETAKESSDDKKKPKARKTGTS